LLRVALTTTGPKNDHPRSPFSTLKDQKVHGDDCKDRPHRQRERTSAPKKRRRRGPLRSKIGPAIMQEIAPIAIPTDEPG